MDILKKKAKAARYYLRHKEKIKANSRAYCTANKELKASRDKKYREENPEKCRKMARNKHLKKKYGITLEQFEILREKQQGCCKICGREAYLVVDHCHIKGKVRGLLCGPCNTKLGYYEIFLKEIGWNAKADFYLGGTCLTM